MIVLRVKLIVGRMAFWLAWPLWLLILRGSERTRVLLVAKGQVLLTRGTLSAGDWSLPGGGVHRGEDVAIGACREIYEELGFVLSADQVKELAVEPARNSGITYKAHFLVIQLEDCITPMPGIEVAEARWVPVVAVQNLRHDVAVTRALELLAAR